MQNKIEYKFDKKELYFILTGIPVVTLIVLLAYSGYYGNVISAEMGAGVFTSFSSTLFIWLGCRTIATFLWRKYPWHINPVKHILVEIPLIVAYTLGIGFLINEINTSLFDIPAHEQGVQVMDIVFTLVITFFILSIHEGWFFFTNWKTSMVNEEKLKKENMESQLETLKNQLNPHFLFNTLNTLSTLIEEDKKTAIEYVERTADFFRSILSLKEKDIIPLAEELELIENFYHLQQKRYGENLHLKIEMPGNLKSTFVAPLTFQMLTENAIKHNIISKDNPLHIEIYAQDDYLLVRNNLQKRNDANPSSGIGLPNIIKRYGFLTSKPIEINKENETFTVKIPILREA